MTTNDLLTDQMTEMKAELAELRAEVRRLRSVDTPPSSPAPTATEMATETDDETSRRQLLRRGGLAIGAGLAAATVVGRPAAAVDGDDIRHGTNTTGVSGTSVTATGVDATALAGFASAANGAGWGVQGTTLSPDGIGVIGTAGGPGGGSGVVGVAGVGPIPPSGGGVVGVDSNDFGAGVYGDVGTAAGATGVFGSCNEATALAMYGKATVGTGVLGSSQNGLGGDFFGTQAGLRIQSSGAAPTTLTDAHTVGELYFDSNNDLWICTAAGSPGTWRKLTNPTLQPVAGFRVYDSRKGGGPITSAAPRTLSVKDAIHTETGAVTVPNSVPAGATGVTFNLTIVNTVGGGFLAVTPGNATTSGSASVNWSATGQTVGNGGVASLDSNRQVKIFAGHTTGGGADAILDITGYFI